MELRDLLNKFAIGAIAAASLFGPTKSMAGEFKAKIDLVNSEIVVVDIPGSYKGGAYAGPILIQGLGPDELRGYCVDLRTEVSTDPVTFDAPVYGVIGVSNTGGPPAFPDSAYTDVGNRLGFLMDTVHPTTPDEYAGLQLALWNQIDKTFSVLSGAPPTYQIYLNQLADDYKSSTTYGNDTKLIWAQPGANGGGRPYQNLIVNGVPEPTSIISLSVGLVFAVLVRSRLRTRSAKRSAYVH